MSEEISNVSMSGNSAESNNIAGKSVSGNSMTGNSSQEKIPYPRSYGTDIEPEDSQKSGNKGATKDAAKGALDGENTANKKGGKNNSKPARSRDFYLQELQDKGTVLTAPFGGVQSIDDYEFEFSPETVLDNILIDDFKNFALDNQMSVESAQQVAKFYESFAQKTNANNALQSRIMENEMRSSCESDVEYGGSKFHENMRYAKAAITRFDDGSLDKLLTETGFGSHPEVVRFMYRVGQALSEKSMAVGQSPQRELSAAELFYPSMRKS